MKTMELSRRQFLKGTGALIVSFNLFPPATNLFAQATAVASPIRPNSIPGSPYVRTAR